MITVLSIWVYDLSLLNVLYHGINTLLQKLAYYFYDPHTKYGDHICLCAVFCKARFSHYISCSNYGGHIGLCAVSCEARFSHNISCSKYGGHIGLCAVFCEARVSHYISCSKYGGRLGLCAVFCEARVSHHISCLLLNVLYEQILNVNSILIKNACIKKPLYVFFVVY